jgi:ketosteroid isomerase-like protein
MARDNVETVRKVCSGIEEIRAFWEAIFEAFDREGMEVDDVAQAGNTVVVRLHSWGTGKSSGAPIDVRWASVYELEDGKVVNVDVHGDYGKAPEAAGLSD